ncbi:MAG: hypothetical protein IJS28_07465 [Synergistaceae bacterium]|nr:hypothetical protein [Synergistaceae bacterium]
MPYITSDYPEMMSYEGGAAMLCSGMGFGERCAYLPDSSSRIKITNSTGMFNLSPSKACEFEVFIKPTDRTAQYTEQGYSFYDGHTFKCFTTLMTWAEAKAACEEIGGHLATSTNSAKNAFLASLTNANAWLGATDEESEGTWKWITGEDWSYTNWNVGQPDNAGQNEHYLNINFGSAGKWNDWTPTKTLHFICEWDYDFRDNSSIIRLGDLVLALTAENHLKLSSSTWSIEKNIQQDLAAQGYKFYDGHSFKFFNDKVSWTTAKAACEALGGHLATSTSAEKNSFLTAITTEYSWLGATDEAQEGVWQWVTGEDWNYNNWNSNEPNNSGGAEHYLQLNYGRVGGWNDYSNYQQLGYICEWDEDFNKCLKPEQWYRIILRVSDECVTVILDGVEVIRENITGSEEIKPECLELGGFSGYMDGFSYRRSSDSGGFEVYHEELIGILGGDNNGHYHFTSEEWAKMRKLIAAAYPDGAEDPVIGGGNVSNPDLPDDTMIDYGPAGMLPSSQPPAWGIAALPKKYSLWGNPSKMYYGCIDKKGYFTNEVLVVPMRYGNSTKSQDLMFTNDLQTWTRHRSLRTSTYGTGFTEYAYASMDNKCSLYTVGLQSNKKQIYYHYTFTASKGGGISSFATKIAGFSDTQSFIACAHSPEINLTIFVADNGAVIRRRAGLWQRKEGIHIGMNVNPGCAAWDSYHKIFCVTGANASAVSSNGVDWTVSENAPQLLYGLEYRDDLKVFIAWSLEDRLFYVSADGINWTRYSQTAIPLANASAVAYCPDFGWYCAIGSRSQYAYFSKNLKTGQARKSVMQT